MKQALAKLKKIKWLSPILGIAALGLFSPIYHAHADTTGATVQLLGGLVGGIVYIILLIANTIGGVLIALITYLTGIILQLSTNVVNAYAVQTGFSVTLAIANLGFVLAIIIIAIATILHRETYGVKKTLWKLVTAAVLVNFSLVIGGAFISFSNTFTNSFLSQLPGTGPNNPSPFEFAKQLSAAFSPQRAFISSAFASSTAAAGGSSSWLGSVAKAVAGSTGPLGSLAASVLTGGTSGQDLASVFTPLVSLAMALGFLIVIVITLAVFLFMLVVRYVALAILLIIMPLAWLMWLFPKTANLWSRWWNTFLRWTFFAPIVIFFLWLAIATANALNGKGGTNDLAFLNGAGYQPEITGIMAPVAAAIGSFIGTFATTALSGIIVIGLALGGMIVADKMSITGAAAGISGAKWVGNKAKGFAWDRTKQGGRWAGRQLKLDKAANAMREGRVGVVPKKLESVPYLGKVAKGANWAATRVTGIAGRAVVPHMTNEDLVEKYKKDLPKNPEDIKKELLDPTLPLYKKIARIQRLNETGELDKNVKVGNQTVEDFMDAHRGDFDNANAAKSAKDIDKALFGDKAMRDAAKEVEALTASGKDASAALDKLDEATKKFLADLKPGDVAKANVNAAFEKPNAMTKSLIKNLAQTSPQLFPQMLRKAKGKTITSIQDQYNGILADDSDLVAFEARSKSEIQAIQDRSKDYLSQYQKGMLSDKELADYQQQLKKEHEDTEKRLRKEKGELEARYNRETFNRIIGNNMFGFGGDDTSGSVAPSAPTPTP